MAVYPSKQTAVIFIVCMMAVLGFAYYVHGDALNSAMKLGRPLELSASGQTTALATTGQSLPSNGDWKSQFLASSSTKTGFSSVPTIGAVTKQETLTATDQLGRAFMNKYAELRQLGLTSDSNSVTNVMSQVSANNIDSLPAPKTYLMKDISVSGSGNSVLDSYGANLLLDFQNYMPHSNEAEIAIKAFDDSDMTELALIDPVIAGYQALIKRLAIMSVPKPVAQYHLDLLNGISMSLFNAQALRHLDTDPVRGLSAIGLEMVGLQKTLTAFSNIQSYFASVGVPFGNK